MVNERTSLFSEARPGPSYVFPGRQARVHQRQMKHFQCCICAAFLTIILMGLIITISYTISNIPKDNDTDNNTTDIVTGSTNIFAQIPLNESDIINLLTLMKWPLIDEPVRPWQLPELTIDEKQMAVNDGLKLLGDREILEETISKTPINTPSYRHQKAVSTTAESRKLSKRGYVENCATNAIAKRHSFHKKPGRWDIGNGPDIQLIEPNNKIYCNFNAKYRNNNGTCNNPNHPLEYGVAMHPFRRSLRPDYSDGISLPRMSHLNKTLPSARDISLKVHRPSYTNDPNFTVMLAVWGQFLDHDITATALNQGQDGEPIDCCTENRNTNVTHPECFVVPLGSNDPYFDKYNISCMNFIRSAPAPTDHFGPREQLNQATSFIDGSVVYGSTDERVNMLRLKSNGLLRMFNTPDNRTLLPVSTNPLDGCNEQEMNAKGKYCFESGDLRANENLHLTSMHLLWARHHNSLANNLQQINAHWNDERIFQESKRILAAQMQHITYNEFLPILLGHDYCKKVGITTDYDATQDTYDSYINPSIANVFAASAFRFAHTLLPGLMQMTKDDNSTESIELHKMLFNPYSLWGDKGLDNALSSAIVTSLEKSDPYFTTEITERLFQSNKTEDSIASNLTSSKPITNIKGCGLDLVSLNIQRGRDHGLPSYSEWRKFCKLPATDTWDDLKYAIDQDSLKNMMEIYNDPRDIDVYTGSLSEPPLKDAIVGPLLACFITDQFSRIKKGDSHWYERRVGSQRFSKEQLQQIFNTTLSSVICRNSDFVGETQKYVMKRINDHDNKKMNCSELDTFNFEPWAEESFKEVNHLHSTRINSAQSKVASFIKIINTEVNNSSNHSNMINNL